MYTDANQLDKYFELFNRGAQLAKDKHDALDNKSLFPDLPPEQVKYLKADKNDVELRGEEGTGFWGQSKYLKGSLLSACLAGIIQ